MFFFIYFAGIDFTKSNEWTGKRSFGGRCLHAISIKPFAPLSEPGASGVTTQHHEDEKDQGNPYEVAISIIGRTLAEFDSDQKIPTFGFGVWLIWMVGSCVMVRLLLMLILWALSLGYSPFLCIFIVIGDARTTDRAVFPIGDAKSGVCNGFEHVLQVLWIYGIYFHVTHSSCVIPNIFHFCLSVIGKLFHAFHYQDQPLLHHWSIVRLKLWKKREVFCQCNDISVLCDNLSLFYCFSGFHILVIIADGIKINEIKQSLIFTTVSRRYSSESI